MKQTSKKSVRGIVVAMLLCVVTVVAGMGEYVQAASNSWKFEESSFNSLGKITASVTVDGLTLHATSSKNMEVKKENATVDGSSYSYCLAMRGDGQLDYRSVQVPVQGDCSIQVVLKSSSSKDRTLVVADEAGEELGTLLASSEASSVSYDYSGDAGSVYLYSADGGINLYQIQIGDGSSSGEESESTSESESESEVETEEASTEESESETETETVTTEEPEVTDGAVVTTYKELVSAISTAEKAGGGTVYVKGTSIDCTAQLALSKSSGKVSIIGLQNSDGSYPVLDFTSFREAYIGKETSDDAVGVRISGGKYTLQNLIIEKAPDNGIQIKGSSANNNTIEDCIVRYNNDAGLQITGGASNNTIRFVYSYRNCDVYTVGGNADGFAPKLGATTGNTFYGCYAWENSDDGWDSFDKTSGYTYDLSYEECATWNNGDPTIFTGEYDYNNGNALDTNLLIVELICAKDSSFASNYAKGKFSLPSGSFVKTKEGTLSLADWTGSEYQGNPNGFKFGSANTTSDCVRTVKNCLSFGHDKKGFDNNNSSCTASFTNCVSFDNGYNYYIPPFTLTKFSNILGFSGESKDKLPSGYSTTTPSSSTQSAIRNTVSSTVDTIVTNCKNNQIEEVYFDIY